MLTSHRKGLSGFVAQRHQNKAREAGLRAERAITGAYKLLSYYKPSSGFVAQRQKIKPARPACAPSGPLQEPTNF
jgi:hypothetical protein